MWMIKVDIAVCCVSMVKTVSCRSGAGKMTIFPDVDVVVVVIGDVQVLMF